MKKMRLIERLFGGAADDEEPDLSEVNLEEKEMIQGIVELSDRTVKEIMVPRIDVVSVSIDTPSDEIVRIVYDSGHSRFPVYQDTIDNIVGILYAKDLLEFLVKRDQPIDIRQIIRKPYFVPESKKLDSMLREFRRRRVHIAVAVDEYGGTSGIVCMEDIIEEIVGDIQDEFDNETEDILEIGDRVYLCDARASLSDLSEHLGTLLPDDDSDTLGGFVFDLFGKIPVNFEKTSYGNIDFVVQEMDGHKIRAVKVISNRSAPAAMDEDR